MTKTFIYTVSMIFSLCMFGNRVSAQDMGIEMTSNGNGSYTVSFDNGTTFVTDDNGNYSASAGEGSTSCNDCLPPATVVGYLNPQTGVNTYTWNIPVTSITIPDLDAQACAETLAQIAAYAANNPPPPTNNITITPGLAIALAKLFKCFSQIPDAGATYSMSICADLPNNSNPGALLSGATPGHAFITLTKTNGTSSMSQSFGFYPVYGPLSMSMAPVAGQIQDNGGHEYDAKLTQNITVSQFQAAQAEAISDASCQYQLFNNNCTDYAEVVFNSGATNPINVPDWVSGVDWGQTPNGVYAFIKNLVNTPGINATVGTTNAPATHGQCN